MNIKGKVKHNSCTHLLFAKHQKPSSCCDADACIGSSSTLADINSNSLQKRGQEIIEIFGGGIRRGYQHLYECITQHDKYYISHKNQILSVVPDHMILPQGAYPVGYKK